MTHLFLTFLTTESLFNADTEVVNICFDGEISFILSFEHVILRIFCFRLPMRTFSGSGMIIEFCKLVFELNISCKFDFLFSNLDRSIFLFTSADNLLKCSAFIECVCKICIRSPPGPCFLIIEDCLLIDVFD